MKNPHEVVFPQYSVGTVGAAKIKLGITTEYDTDENCSPDPDGTVPFFRDPLLGLPAHLWILNRKELDKLILVYIDMLCIDFRYVYLFTYSKYVFNYVYIYRCMYIYSLFLYTKKK